MNQNSIQVIHPYLDRGTMVFDDPAVGLVKEAFVAGADEVLATLAGRVCEDWTTGFTLLFSHEPFPGFQAKMTRVRPEYGGYVYFCEGLQQEGWLCPALFKYFAEAPENLYIQIKE
jgi:hypothetical protein